MTGAMDAKRLPRNLFLVGYRGVGKTTVASHLAGALGWLTVDADLLVETRAGRSIRQIFGEDGEAGFRRLETEVLRDICTESNQVVATGGGVVLAAENRDSLAQAGWCVWLEADVDTIEHRLLADPGTAERRPALSGGGRAEIEKLLRVREPLYAAVAQGRFRVDGRTPEEVAQEILTWLRKQGHEAENG
jgi:shikimate kinase